MPYKYKTLTPITSSGSILKNEFQALVNAYFEVAPDYYTVREESTFGSRSYSDVDVRITKAINVYTGLKLGDDFKTLIFKDLSHAVNIGMKYFFDNNYFIVINTEIYKSLAQSCIIRRCNNVLRWMDFDGNYYEEPCIIDYPIKRPTDSIGTINPVTPNGFIEIYAQLNEFSKLITPNQRFLFGNSSNWTAFKVYGSGLKNFENLMTMDNDSAQLLKLEAGVDYENSDDDDLVNGIADRYKHFSNLTSGSDIGVYDVVVNPIQNYILESGSVVFDVRYYSGSVIQSGSFVFSVSGSSVPTNNYLFTHVDDNSFRIDNIERYSDHSLDILCDGINGSRVLSLDLRGDW